MTINLPARFDGLVDLGPGQIIDLGRPTDLSPQQPFAVAGWFCMPPRDGQARTLLSQPGVAALSVNTSGQAVATVGGAFITTGDGLVPGRWYQLAVNCTLDGGSATVDFYVDGVLIGSVEGVTCALPSPMPNIVLGDSVGGTACRRVSLWSAPLPSASLVQLRFQEPVGDEPTLAAAFQFTRAPARDVSTANHPLSYVGGAMQRIQTRGLDPGDGNATTSPELGDLGSSPFTIQAWVQFQTPASGAQQDIVTIGSPGQSFFALSANSDSGGQLTLGMRSNGHGGGHITTVDTFGWSNLALTWDPAQAWYTLYLNGVLINQGAMASPGSIDALLTVGSAADGSRTFAGSVQSVAIWDRVLSAEEIAVRQYPDPIDTDTPLSLLDLSLDPPKDLIAGEPVTLNNNARVATRTYSGTNISSQTPTTVEAARQTRIASRQAAFDQVMAPLQPTQKRQIDPALFDDARIADIAAPLIQRLAGSLSDEERAAIRAGLEGALSDAFARARSGQLSLSGTFRSEVLDGVTHTFFYDAQARPKVAYKHSRRLTSCESWMVDMVATGLFGLLDVLGVPMSSGAIAKAVSSLITKSKVARAFATVLEDTITADTIIAMVEALDDTNYLETFVEDILSHLSWWDFLWMVTDVVVELVALFIPGAELAVVFLKLASTVTKLLVIYSEKPSNCP